MTPDETSDEDERRSLKEIRLEAVSNWKLVLDALVYPQAKQVLDKLEAAEVVISPVH